MCGRCPPSRRTKYKERFLVAVWATSLRQVSALRVPMGLRAGEDGWHLDVGQGHQGHLLNILQYCMSNVPLRKAVCRQILSGS